MTCAFASQIHCKHGSGDGFLSLFNKNAITHKLPLKAAICLANLTTLLTS